MQPADVKVEVRNKSLAVVGELDLTEGPEFDLHLMRANVGSWSIKIPYEHEMTDHLLTPGSGIIVTLNGKRIASGPTIQPELAQNMSDPVGVVEFVGVTDNILLADALAWPDPFNIPKEQTKAWDERTGPCETLMHQYVRANIGPNALAHRKVANLVMGANGARGKEVTRKPRFNSLGTLVAGLARTGRLGFEIIQIGSNLEFRTYALQDKSATIILDVEDESLLSTTLSKSAPTATDVIIGGRGHGKKRKFREAETPESAALRDEWGRRIEVYMDYRGGEEEPDPTDLIRSGKDWLDDELNDLTQLRIQPSDYADHKYGTDWELGDKITVMVNGQSHKVKATGLLLIVDENGARYGISLGDPVFSGGSRASMGTKIKPQMMEYNPNSGNKRPPGMAQTTDEWASGMALETPDLGETTLDGVDYVVEHRVLLLENGQTVEQWMAANNVSGVQVGTVVFEKT